MKRINSANGSLGERLRTFFGRQRFKALRFRNNDIGQPWRPRGVDWRMTLGLTSRLRSYRAILLALTLISAGALVEALFTHPSEPRQGGYPLSAWVKTLSSRNLQEFGPGCGYDHAPEAISQMGTNSLPFLVEWLSYQCSPTPVRDSVNWALEACPSLSRYDALANWAWFDTKDVRGEGAYIAFGILGSTATPAIPGLVAVATRGGDIMPRYRAVCALEGIGPPALPALCFIATNQIVPITNQLARINEGGVRYEAAASIGRLGGAAKILVPDLIRLLDDDEPEAAAGAAEALANVPIEQAEISNVVRKLVAACLRPNTMLQQSALHTLGKLGPAAVDAVPILLKAASLTSDNYFKITAQGSIKTIQAEVSGKAKCVNNE